MNLPRTIGTTVLFATLFLFWWYLPGQVPHHEMEAELRAMRPAKPLFQSLPTIAESLPAFGSFPRRAGFHADLETVEPDGPVSVPVP